MVQTSVSLKTTNDSILTEPATIHQVATGVSQNPEMVKGEKNGNLLRGHGKSETKYQAAGDVLDAKSSNRSQADELRDILDERIYPLENDVLRLHLKLDDLGIVVKEVCNAFKIWDSKLDMQPKETSNTNLQKGKLAKENFSKDGSLPFASLSASRTPEMVLPQSTSLPSTCSSSPATALTTDSVPITSIASAIQELARTLVTQEPPRWEVAEVGYFVPAEHTLPSINSTIIYSDVFQFVDRVRDYATLKGDKLVASHLFLCLRGDALLWYGHLSSAKKKTLQQSLSTWCTELILRFKMPGVVALQKLCNRRYTINDVRSGSDISDYLYSIVRYARSAGFDQVSDQIDFAYRGLDPKLRENLASPSADISIAGFEGQLRARLRTWTEEYGRSKEFERIIIRADPDLTKRL